MMRLFVNRTEKRDMETAIQPNPLAETLVEIRAILATCHNGQVGRRLGQDLAFKLWDFAQGTLAIDSVQTALTASLSRNFFTVTEIEALCVEVESSPRVNETSTI